MHQEHRQRRVASRGRADWLPAPAFLLGRPGRCAAAEAGPACAVSHNKFPQCFLAQSWWQGKLCRMQRREAKCPQCVKSRRGRSMPASKNYYIRAAGTRVQDILVFCCFDRRARTLKLLSQNRSRRTCQTRWAWAALMLGRGGSGERCLPCYNEEEILAALHADGKRLAGRCPC